MRVKVGNDEPEAPKEPRDDRQKTIVQHGVLKFLVIINPATCYGNWLGGILLYRYITRRAVKYIQYNICGCNIV